LFIDIVIAIALLVAIWIGYQRGVIQPLLAQIFFLVAILIILRDRHAYLEAMQKYLHAQALVAVFLALIVAVVAGFVGGQVGGMIHRMPIVRGVDGFLGIFVNAAFVLAISYLLLSALIVLDKAFAPTLAAATMSAGQVNTLISQIDSNPLTASLVNQSDLDKLKAETAQPGGARIETVPALDQLQTVYEQFLQPQLASSRTAPYILRFGQHIPVIGHIGPQDLPATPGRTNPTPAPSPTKK
jgi:4-amino-4-deoxy-L-arabinose transferase-like glycosyltransferase